MLTHAARRLTHALRKVAAVARHFHDHRDAPAWICATLSVVALAILLTIPACNLTPAQQTALTAGAADLAQAAACDLLPLSDAPPGVDALACQEAAPAVRVALSAALASSPTPTATSPAKKAAKNKAGKVVAVVPAHLHKGVSEALAK